MHRAVRPRARPAEHLRVVQPLAQRLQLGQLRHDVDAGHGSGGGRPAGSPHAAAGAMGGRRWCTRGACAPLSAGRRNGGPAGPRLRAAGA